MYVVECGCNYVTASSACLCNLFGRFLNVGSVCYGSIVCATSISTTNVCVTESVFIVPCIAKVVG